MHEKLIKALDNLSRSELVELNGLVVERLRTMDRVRTYEALARFEIGDRVTFPGHDGAPLSGMVIRVNRKTITVREGTREWRVGPSWLRHETGNSAGGSTDTPSRPASSAPESAQAGLTGLAPKQE